MKLIKYSLVALVILALSTCSFSRQDLFQVATGQPDISIFPDGAGVFHFGSVGVFATQKQIFTIENSGSQNLEIERIYTSNSDLTQFTIDTSETSSVIEPRNSTTFSVSFKPTNAVSFSVYLIIESNDPDETVITVLLDGFGFGSVSPPVINVRLGDTKIQNGMGNHNFGNVKVGNSNSVEFIIENLGAADLYVGDVALSSGDFIQFNIVSPSLPTSLSAGKKTNFTIDFSPQDALPYNANVAILSDDPTDGTYTFMITGTGTFTPVPDIVVKSGTKEIPNSSGTYDFGTVEIPSAGTNTASATITIENTGSALLTVSGLMITDILPTIGEFTVTAPTLPFSIDPGLSQTVTLDFTLTPSSMPGFLEADLKIFNNDSDENPHTIRLMGFAATAPTPDINVINQNASLDIFPETLGHDFGNLNVGNSSLVTFEIENTGTTALTISGIQLVPVSTDFTLDLSSLSITVSAGGNTTFDLIFSPTESKKKTVSVEIANNDPDSLESPFTFTVRGEGVAPNQPIIETFVGSQEYVNGSTYYFNGGNPVATGASSTEVFTIKNAGQGDLIVDGVLLFSGQAQDFSQDLVVPSTLSPGSSVDFTVIFTPTSSSPSQRRTKIQVSSNDKGRNLYLINLVGIAE